MSDLEDVQILKKSTRLSMRKGPTLVKVKKPIVVEEPVEEPKVEVKEEPVVVVEPVKKEKKPRVKKNKVVPVLSDSSDDAKPDVVEKPKIVKKTNGWIDHVRKYREEHPEVAYKDCLKLAKDCYKKA